MNPPLLLKVKNLKVKKTRQMRKLENYHAQIQKFYHMNLIIKSKFEQDINERDLSKLSQKFA
jgi:hypothetical protein